MNDRQLAHFRNILIAWKRELMEEVDRTVHHMQDEASNFPDPNDRATQESEFGLELRTRDRERKLLKKIDSALQRIEEGSYGYCEETGEEIGLKRLEARPVATLCVEAQERRELAERQFPSDNSGTAKTAYSPFAAGAPSGRPVPSSHWASHRAGHILVMRCVLRRSGSLQG